MRFSNSGWSVYIDFHWFELPGCDKLICNLWDVFKEIQSDFVIFDILESLEIGGGFELNVENQPLHVVVCENILGVALCYEPSSHLL